MEACWSSSERGRAHEPAALAAILPPSAVAATTAGDVAGATPYREEMVAVEGAIERRRREFASGRSCARRALARLGVGPVAIPSGPLGEPLWPAGVVGSITHCKGFRAAAVARVGDLLALGVDAEPNEPVPRRLLASIASAAEAAALRRLAASAPGVHWGRLLFSVKESAYKAWFPLSGERLGFAQAQVSFALGSNSFEVALSGPGPAGRAGRGRSLSGRWTARDGLLLTAAAIAPAGGGTA